ncbi:hypothetical protein J6590_038856 [Homalodisca vitripennis]|nr:hypothetical protein J6590_038856 [Homalodisca vitripennis]
MAERQLTKVDYLLYQHNLILFISDPSLDLLSETCSTSSFKLLARADEIEALCSIYGDQWQTEDELNQAYCVAVTEGKCDAVLHIKLPPEYPSIAPPQYQLSAPTLSREDKQSLSDRLESIYL